MTTPIAGGSGTTSAGATSAASGSAATTGMDQDTFLKLLVAQLKYQDPSKPVDSSQFMSQTAQFTMVEQLTSLASGQGDLLAAQLRLGASNLIGRTVTYPDADDNLITGVVASATFSGSSPTLRVGNTDVPLSSVREVRTAAG
ncbi:MAG: flagellar hook capping protein [Dactylosporangium sp.]|nr:flagellar hook capping protein [Dactylosporangium sp.]NNJ61291.1 flagellar hook capping protein [Dactylosporangium sp.]